MSVYLVTSVCHVTYIAYGIKLKPSVSCYLIITTVKTFTYTDCELYRPSCSFYYILLYYILCCICTKNQKEKLKNLDLCTSVHSCTDVQEVGKKK